MTHEEIIRQLRITSDYFTAHANTCTPGSTGQSACLHTANALTAAAELLEAQGPRVMTLEEIPRHDGAVLFEVRNKDEWAVFSSWDRNRRSKWMIFAFGTNYGHVTGFNIDVYGKTWRCWTSRPTDAQREAVKWDD